MQCLITFHSVVGIDETPKVTFGGLYGDFCLVGSDSQHCRHSFNILFKYTAQFIEIGSQRYLNMVISHFSSKLLFKSYFPF